MSTTFIHCPHLTQPPSYDSSISIETFLNVPFHHENFAVVNCPFLPFSAIGVTDDRNCVLTIESLDCKDLFVYCNNPYTLVVNDKDKLYQHLGSFIPFLDISNLNMHNYKQGFRISANVEAVDNRIGLYHAQIYTPKEGFNIIRLGIYKERFIMIFYVVNSVNSSFRRLLNQPALSSRSDAYNKGFITVYHNTNKHNLHFSVTTLLLCIKARNFKFEHSKKIPKYILCYIASFAIDNNIQQLHK